jgi:photosystem II stability/assembly factor-like uncharacterized protein
MSVFRFRPLFAALTLALPLVAVAETFRDVLAVPALQSPLAAKTLLNGLAGAGKRVVAVGQRGHIVYSDDAGTTWTQAKVPVSADLVAVHFPTARHGWAVGHDGVVLHSTDAGATWVRQLDGRAIGSLFQTYYAELAGRGALGPAAEATALVDEAARVAAQGADVPLLDVWFADPRNGFVVGAFNLVLHTADGGETWTPWSHRTENPNRLHLYAVRGVGSDVYATGEQGLVLKLDAASGRFRALETPYKGTYFGAVVGNDAVLVFGLRGNAFRSIDGGRNWRKVDTDVQDGLTGAAVVGEGKLVLVSQSGRVLVSQDGGVRFSPLKLDRATPASAVHPVGDRAVAIAGARGVRIQSLY